MRLPLLVAAVTLVSGGAGAQEYAFRHYGAEAGLPTAHTVAFDGGGRLLVGTNDGLSQFDGRAFVDVPLPVPGSVWRLAPAPDGSVWALTNRAGLVRLPPGGPPESVPVPPPLRVRLHEKVWPIRIQADARSRPWLSGGDGTLYRWNGPARRSWTAFRVPGIDFVGDFFVRGDGDSGELVVAARDRVGVLPMRAGRPGLTHWLPPFERRVFYVRPHPTALAWVGGQDGVFLLARDGTARHVTADGVWVHNEPDVDASGRLLTLRESSHTGVLRFAPDGTLELAAGAEEGLKDGLAIRFAFSPEGGLWFAHHRGVTALDDERTRTYPLPDETLAFVNGMIGDPARGVLWVSTLGWMYRLEGPRLTAVTGPEPGFAVSPVLEPGGAASWAEYDPDGQLRARSSRSGPTSSQRFLIYDGPGGRYETDPAGLWRIREGRRVRLSAAFLPGATGSEDPAGRLWIGGETGRVDVVWGDSLGSTCAFCVPPSLRAALDTLNARLAVGRVAADPYGHVWIAGATGGLGVLWPEDGPRADARWGWRVLGEDDGLLAQSIPSVTVSPDGQRLWLGTSRGLQGLRLGPGPPRVEPFVELRARDGLEGEVVSAVLEDGDGYLWAAIVPGKVHRLDWRAMAARPPSPAVGVERVEVNGRPAAFGAGGLRLREGDGLAVALWPQTYRQPLRVRLEYRLPGRDTAWVDLGSARRLAFAALPAGRYVLEVRAVREGQAPGPAVRLGLAVAPPFYKATWFFALVVLGVGLAAYGASLVRESRRRAADAVRRRIAEDLHDEVGSGLTEVSLYSELIRREVEAGWGDGAAEGNAATVAAWATRVGDRARALSSSMRDIVWAIRPDEGGWEALELRLKDTAATLLDPRGIALDMEGEGVAPVLPPEVRQHVLLFFKEALHNAVRHGEPTRVTVRWQFSRRALMLRVCDDGRGFDPAAVRPGTGLRSLRRRADALGGALGVESARGRGTCLLLDVPLQGGPAGVAHWAGWHRLWPWPRRRVY